MDLSQRFTQTVNWAQKTGVTAAGDPQFAAAVAVAARVIFEPQMVRHAADGSEIQSGTRVLTLQQLGVEDRVWLPGDSPSNVDLARTPMRVHQVEDAAGNLVYWEAYF